MTKNNELLGYTAGIKCGECGEPFLKGFTLDEESMPYLVCKTEECGQYNKHWCDLGVNLS